VQSAGDQDNGSGGKPQVRDGSHDRDRDIVGVDEDLQGRRPRLCLYRIAVAAGNEAGVDGSGRNRDYPDFRRENAGE
jgi:hypothetical protein